MSPNPNSMAAAILSDPAASYTLKNTLRAFLERDPVDALNDAETLRAAVKDHLSFMMGGARRRGA
jgi:hypothetical protein